MPAAPGPAANVPASKLTTAGVGLFWTLVVVIVVARAVFLNSTDLSFGPAVTWVQQVLASL